MTRNKVRLALGLVILAVTVLAVSGVASATVTQPQTSAPTACPTAAIQPSATASVDAGPVDAQVMGVSVGLASTPCSPITGSFGASVNADGSVTFSWNVASGAGYPVSCHLYDLNGGGVISVVVGASGSQTIGALPSSVTFQLDCSDPYGDGNSWQVTVGPTTTGGGGGTPTPAPTVQLTASPATISDGSSTTLSWTSSNATGCTITASKSGSGGWQNLATNSSVITPSLSAVNSPYTYTETCAGPGGSSSPSSVTVTVNPPAGGGGGSTASPPLVTSFTTNVTGPWSGDSVQLSWTSTSSAACGITSDPVSGGVASGLPANGSWITPSLPAGQMQYTLTCANLAGSATATLYVGVFNADEQSAGSFVSGQNTDPTFWRSLDWVSGCRWKSETNENDLRTRVGLRGGGISTKVDWCVRSGLITKVVRTISIIGPNYPLSGWKFDGVTSYGPCDENCSNYVSLFGTGRSSINIWVQGHWSLCLSIPVIGSLCAQEAYKTVGVLIRGDGTRVDTYSS